ncbi:uncharacterized protein LOC123229806 isoform X2 [Mangifera indica]|uniref:uncharacterized protein LOC123229806 isoform X2 n=1 Tax=Mangifera indica TaxID=29780 RepID=UPI001CFABEF5|nr:uncharacterized protein LOC123229806 isoform X2 [Mangifera indica]
MASKKTFNKNDKAPVKVAAVASDYEKLWNDKVQFVDADNTGGIVNQEEFDFISNLKLTRQRQRRSIASENPLVNSCSNEGAKNAIKKSNENNEALMEAVKVDSNYREFLNYMVQCVGVDSDDDKDEWCLANVNDDDNDDDHVCEVLDAQYMMFLDNLKEEGRSYVLKHALSNGTSVVVKYEEEYDLHTGLGTGNLEILKDCHNIENVNTENFLRFQLEREKIMSPRRILRSNLGKRKNESSRKVLRNNPVTNKIKSSKTVLRNSSRWRKTKQARKTSKSGSVRQDNKSLSLKEALNVEKTESLRTLSINPVGEISKSPSILNDALKREKIGRLATLRSNPWGEKNKSRSIMNDAVSIETTDGLETLRSNPLGENSKSLTILNDEEKRGKTESLRTRWSNPQGEKSRSPIILHDVVKGGKTEISRTLRNGSRSESMRTQKILRDDHSIDKKSPVAETNWKMKIKNPVSCPANGCTIKRHSLEGTHLAKQRFNLGGKEMVQFRDDETDSEVVVLDDPFFTGDNTPFISSRARVHVDEDSEGFIENNDSQFRDGLLEILLKPYDFTEYARLQIESRSYLRMHDDFAEVIRQARHDRRKILNLLRGFFYWLQYMHSEGAFMPWLDSNCLSILPPDDY